MVNMRGLVRAMFEDPRPVPSAPRHTKLRTTNADRRCSSSRCVNKSETSAAPYVAKRLEGEYNVCFHRKPLGVGLVPSSQLYGSWEVSSVQETEEDEEGDARTSLSRENDRRGRDGEAIAKGHVLIAINFSCEKAQLPRADLAAYLRQCSCPIVMTFRDPDVFGAHDSRVMSTAMYPSSMDYSLHCYSTKVVARASAKQWQRSLEHDLAYNAELTKKEPSRNLARTLLVKNDSDASHSHRALSVGEAGDAMSFRGSESAVIVSGVDAEGKGIAGADVSEVGEFDVTFDKTPLHLMLAPSTRLYGTVEVYDPEQHAPTVQVGDVVMAINGYSSISRLAPDDVIDAIAELQAPVTLRFRRPVTYRKYLAKCHSTKKDMSSQSVASSMFPPSAEYKKKTSVSSARKRCQPALLVSQSFVEPEPTDNLLSKTSSAADNANNERAKEFRAFAAKIGALDRFKLWAGSGNPVEGRPLAGHRSAFLTEKHMQFLWKSLPKYLTCNQMELIYTTQVHGWSFLSFFSRLESKGPTIVVVQDEHENIFGAFCSASWRRSKRFFGNGRTFVFSLSPRMRVHPWSGIDSSFMYTHRDSIFVGGGSKGIALCLQLDDRRGFTHACSTFDSPPLVDYQTFRCETVEVWSFHGLNV